MNANGEIRKNLTDAHIFRPSGRPTWHKNVISATVAHTISILGLSKTQKNHFEHKN